MSTEWLIFDPLGYEISWVPIRPDKLHPKERAQAMKDLYPDAENPLPLNMPEPRGFLIFINMAPIQWYSKKSKTLLKLQLLVQNS